MNTSIKDENNNIDPVRESNTRFFYNFFNKMMIQIANLITWNILDLLRKIMCVL